jgi:hypothetical protein
MHRIIKHQQSWAKMTLARPIRTLCLVFCLIGPGSALAGSEPLLGTSEQVSLNPLTGLAIDGFDPVAYFVEARARAGKPDYEITWRGATWRFANAANRDAFLADPEIFAPAFGGFDADAISRGVKASSDPGLFAIIAGRLYLFRSVDGRERFQDAALHPVAARIWSTLEPRPPR